MFEKAKEVFENSDIKVLDHFSDAGKIVEMESDKIREVEDIMLSRYEFYFIVQNRGYQGLYGALGVKEIQERKGLKKSYKILDYMGSTELVEDLFRTTRIEQKIRHENIISRDNRNEAYYQVVAKVRKTIKELGETIQRIY